LIAVSILMTVGVYGIVAAIVKLDDVGFWLEKKASALAKKLGLVLISAAPKLMKFLSVVGTAAMFLVGGGIICHGIHAISHAFESWTSGLGIFTKAAIIVLEGIAGVIAGAIVLGAVLLIQKLFKKQPAA
jgi:predicted DNA repair protein MutK